MKRIALSNGGFALVDDEDYEHLNQWRWKRINSGYVARTTYQNGKFPLLLMHRYLTNPPEDFETDHINRNKLDNQKGNLRIVTHAQNERNKSLTSRNSSGYMGVTWDKERSKWMAKTKHLGKWCFIGRYDTPYEAHLAYVDYVSSLSFPQPDL